MKKQMKKQVFKKFIIMLLAACIITQGATIPVQAAESIVIDGDATSVAKAALSKKTATIVNKVTKKNDSKKAKLKKLFQYTEKTYGYARATGFQNNTGWDVTYATQMINKKQGSCYHFAAAFAYLAKKATGYPVRICLGTTNGFNKSVWQSHAWVEVKIGKTWYICDPNMDKFAAKSSMKYYLKKSSSLKKTFKAKSRITVKF